MADDGIIIDLGIADFVQSMAQIGQFQVAVKGLDATFRKIVASSLKAASSVGSLRKEYEALAAAQKAVQSAGTLNNAAAGTQQPTTTPAHVTVKMPRVSSSAAPVSTPMPVKITQAAPTVKMPRQIASSFGNGPATNLQRAQAQRQQAFASGNPAQQFNAQYAYFKANRAYQNAQKAMYPPPPPSFGKKLWTVLQSSRFGMTAGGGFQLMPLVGRTMAALGPFVSGIGIAALAVVAVGKALFDLAAKAAEAGNKFAALQFQTGGTGKETGRLSSLGNDLGVDTGSAATRLNESMKSGVGASFGSRIGIHANMGAFSDTDNARNLLNTIKEVRNIDKTLGRSEAVRMLRALGIEDMQAALNISDAMYTRIKADGDFKNSLMDPTFKQNSADFSAAFGRIGDAMQNLTIAIAKPFLPLFTNLFNGIADWINGFAGKINENPQFGQGIANGIDAVMGAFAGFKDFLTPIVNGFKAVFTNLYKVFQGVASVLAPVFAAIGAQVNFFNSLITTVGTVIGAGVQAFGELIGEIGKALGIFGPSTGPFLVTWQGFWKAMEDTLNGAAEWINTHQNVFKGITEIIIGIMEVLTLRVNTGWKKIQDGIKDINTPDPKKVKTDDKHVDAMNRHSAAMDDFNAGLRNGTFGGGERARGAIPGKWDGANLQQLDWAHKAASLGAFAF